MALAATLVADGLVAVSAGSLGEARVVLRDRRISVAILGVRLPDGDGSDFLHELRGDPKFTALPIVMLSSEAQTGAFDAVIAQIHELVASHAPSGSDAGTKRSETEATEARAARQIAEARAALAEQLARSNFELAAANRELEAFSFTVSHDLRAPLRTIRSFAQMLEEDAGATLDAQSRDHLQRVIAATARMGDLIDALLELSRVSRVAIARMPTDVGTIAAVVIDELRGRDPDRSVQVWIAPKLSVKADPRLVRSLLDNVIGNAWKFTAQTPAARIEVGAVDNAFFVRDNGVGFDMAHAKQLFTPFQRLHGSEFPGTGIGLATVRRIVERHGGRVWAESSAGIGTTIYFTLPGH